MPSNQIMILAGEASGDALGADLVTALNAQAKGQVRPQFFGLGGPKMRLAGVDLLKDMTQQTVFGLVEALRQYGHFKAIFNHAFTEAVRRRPDLLVFIDFGGFNLRFAKAIQAHAKAEIGPFHNWHPKMIYFVPPQVWASREKRAQTIASTMDLVISIFPFERDWYMERFPNLPIRYVGDPLATRFSDRLLTPPTRNRPGENSSLRIALLPGSRQQEIDRHLPLMLEALTRIQSHRPAEATVISPNEALVSSFRDRKPIGVKWETGSLHSILENSDLAIASSGTVTRECAYLRLPTVVIYQLSQVTYEIAKRIVKVDYIAMPNLLAEKMIYPELIQQAATPTAIAQEALQLCQPDTYAELQQDLERVVLSLGPPGATQRAAQHIQDYLVSQG